MTWAPRGMVRTRSANAGRTTRNLAPVAERTSMPSGWPRTWSWSTTPAWLWKRPPAASRTRYLRPLLSRKSTLSPCLSGPLTPTPRGPRSLLGSGLAAGLPPGSASLAPSQGRWLVLYDQALAQGQRLQVDHVAPSSPPAPAPQGGGGPAGRRAPPLRRLPPPLRA